MYFRALPSQSIIIFFSQGDNRFWLTFIDFFMHVRAWRKCYLKRSYDPSFYFRVFSVAILKFFPREIFLCFTYNDWSCMLIDF